MDLARPLGAAGAAGNLMRKLERALGRAQVATGKAEIRVDHPHQREQRKVMALRHHLGSDQHVDRVVFDAADQLRDRARTRQCVARDHRESRLRESRTYLLGKSLDAGPAGRERAGGAAGGAEVRHLLEMPTVMALQLAHESVLDQLRRAVRALEAMATVAAE